ncbi:hypothetical protein ACEPAG_4280 [Sanghuangporus baumii]
MTAFSYNFVLTIDDELKPFAFGSVFYVLGKYLAAASLIYTFCTSATFISINKAICSTYVGNVYSWLQSRDFWSITRSAIQIHLQMKRIQQRFFVAASGFPYKVLRYTGALVTACAMILLQLRTYALYAKSKKIVFLFGILNIVAVLFFVVQAALLTSSSKNNVPVASFKPLPVTLHSSIYWSPFLLNEMVTFSLAVVKLLKIRMDFENVRMERSLNLTRTVIRDNMIYFSVIFIVYVSGLFLLIDLEIEEAYAGTFTLACIAVSGIMAPNLLLMLKKGYYNQGQDIKLATDISTFHVTMVSPAPASV